MCDKKLIKKFCNLTCSKKEICRSVNSIHYDEDHPFEKYYNANSIIGALNKYLSKEWNDEMLAHWCCVYDYILCGGFKRNLKEDFTSLEEFLVNEISWDLDGLSFFDEKDWLDNGINDILEWIEQYKNLDHIWQTRNSWKAVYAKVGPYADDNEDQYVVLINDELKEYMIINSNHLENGFEDEIFKYVTEEELGKLIEQMKEKYKILSYAEKWYFLEYSD